MAVEQIRFTTRVLGPVAAYRLEKRQISQTLRSNSNPLTASIISGLVSAGDHLEVFLDRIFVGRVELVSMDAVKWEALGIRDAQRGGFDTLDDLPEALRRAGYRFMPLNDYQLYRIQFAWLEEAPA